jgi:hypothetical protein
MNLLTRYLDLVARLFAPLSWDEPEMSLPDDPLAT